MALPLWAATACVAVPAAGKGLVYTTVERKILPNAAQQIATAVVALTIFSKTNLPTVCHWHGETR